MADETITENLVPPTRGTVPAPEHLENGYEHEMSTSFSENPDDEREEHSSETKTGRLREEQVLVASLSETVIVEEAPVTENIIVETSIVEYSDNDGIGASSGTSAAELREEEVSVASPTGTVAVQEVPLPESSIVETPAVESSIVQTPAVESFVTRPVVARRNDKTVVPIVELRNGRMIPAIGFGTWEIQPAEAYHAVKNAINAGFRHIDCALIYQNESSVGAAIADSIKDGVVAREDLFVTSKLWNTFHKPTLVEATCRQSLEDLGLEYLDLYLIHTPIGFREGKNLVPKIAGVIQYSDTDYLEAWYAMEGLVKKGLVRSIGLSNFNSQQVQRVVSKAKVMPVTNQVECHPLLNQSKLSECCSELGVVLTAYSALCVSGELLGDPTVLSVAEKYGRTPAHILLRYQLDKGNVVLTRSLRPERMLEALAAAQFQLEGRDLQLLDSMNRNRRFLNLVGLGNTHKDYPFKIPF